MDENENTVDTPESIATPDPNALEDAPNLTVEEIFNFDPFAEGTEQAPTAPEPPSQPEGEEVTVSGDATPPPPAPEVVETPTPTPVPDPRLAQLEEQNRLLLEMVTRNQQQQTQATPSKPPEEPKKEDYPNYMFQVPPQIAEMLQSEDPNAQRQGLAALIAGMGRTVHEHLRREYQETLNNRIQSFREQFVSDQQRAEQARAVYNDFYTTYPQLNRPELRGVVEYATRQVVAEEKASTWSASLRDKIGSRVLSVLGQVGTPSAEPGSGGLATPAPVVAGNGSGGGSRSTPRPPKMRGTSTRPATEAPPEPGSQEAHMFDVLKGTH